MNTDFAAALDQVIAPPPPTGAAPPTPAGAPPLPTPANDTFGAAVDEVASTIRGPGALPDNNRNVEEQRDAQANLLLARRTNPDTAGRAMVAATETGLPSDVAMRNPDVADEEAYKQQSAKLLREARGTAQFFADQRNAAVAHDKVAQMGTWERLMYAASSGAKEGWQDTEISPLVEKEMNGQPLTPGEKTLVEGWREERRVPSGLPDWSVSAGVRNSAAFVTGLTSQLVKSAPLALEGGLAAGGITAVSGLEPLVPVMTAAGASAGLQAGMFDQGRKQATAFTYERLRELQDEKGATLDPQTVRYISNGVGTIGGLLNIIGFGQAAKPVGSLASSVTRLLIEDAAVKPSVGAALRAIGGGTVKGFGMGLGLGAANEASMVGGETLAAEINNILQGTKFTDILNDSAKRDEAARAIADSAINMGLTLAGLHVATGAPRLATEAMRVQRAAADARFYDSVVNGADASGLVNRPTGRDAIQRFLGLQLDDGPHENVYIPAAKLVELYQDAQRIGAANDPLLGHIEGLGKQVTDALPVNGDVVIPAKDFFSKLVGTPALDKLKGDLRMRDDGLSLNEARDAVAKHGEFLKAEQARWEAQLEAGVAEVDPAARVFEDMRDRLRIKAGYTESTATHQAALYASHYEARAQRSPDLYGDAWEAYQKAGTGKGVEVQATVPEAIRGAAPDRLDVLLNSLRSGKEPTAPEPETLGKFLKRTPGTPDIQARAAHEAGFFPEHTDTPTSEHLAAALAEEKAGRPRISEQAPKDHGEEFRADRQQLSDTLKGMGVDPKTATNKQVRAALAKAIEAEDKGPTHEQPARGSITFGDNRAIIRLFQGRDLSTLLHESGHLWLAEIEFDAKDANAPEQLKADYQTVLDFLGSTDGYITREQHEKFARSFETYLMEGKAPSNALAAAFSSFRNWLTQIYRRLSALDAPIDPEMRGVFDRLVASDDAIKSARETQALNPIFKDAKSAGMTEAQFQAYTERANAAVDEAERRTLDKAMEAIRRQRTKEWKADERRVRDDVRSEIMRDPGQRALHLLRTGKMFGAETPEVLLGVKLSKESIVEAYGDDSVLRMLPPGIFRDREAGPGVIAADDLASVMGFDTGKAMLDRLMALESQRQAMVEKGDKRSVVKASVDEETARRMGPPIDQQAIADEAMAAVHGDKQAALMGAELAALARRADHAGAQISLDDVKAWAAKTIGEMPARQVQTFDRFLKAERAAGEAAERALLKGDYLAAFKAKQDQLANSRLYVEAKKAAGEIDSARRLMDRYAGERTIKGMDQDYLDQIHGLLEGYDFKRRSDAEIKKVQGFELWAANQTKEGIDHLGEALSDRMKAQIGKLNYRDITVDEMRGLADTVKQIAKLGRLSKELTVGLEKRDFDATLNEFQSQLQGIRQIGRPDERNPEVAGAGLRERARAWLVRAKAGARAFDASLLHMEQIADWADGGNPNGLFNTLLFRPFADAQARENDLLGEYAKKMQDAADAVPKEIKAGWTKRIDVPELRDKGRGRGAFLKSDLVAMALNLGNDSNKQKMLRGDGWDEDTVKAVLDKHLMKEDWEFVQRMWDTIEELWPKAAELERRVNGVEAPKIEATPVETKFGTFRGGYYPAAYDLSLSAEARASWAKRQGGLFDENTYTRATTSQGYQKGRTEFSAPILLDLNVIPKHIAQVIHDITHREAIRQAAKIVLDKRFIDGFEGAFGHEFYQIMMPWLQSVAGNLSMDDTGLSWWMKTVKAIRVNTSLVGMGLRGSTMIQQVTGNFDTAEVLGAKWAAVGNAAFVGDPARMLQTRDFVFEKSGEMRHRMDNTERDIREGLRSLLGKNDALSEVRRFAYYGVGMFDMMVSMPAWMGGYKKALSEGMADHDAVYYADKVVRLSQGAGGVKDLAAVQSSRNEMMKLFSMFYSWASHFYNRQRDIGRSATEAEGGHDFAMIAARSIFLMVLPALSGPLLTGNGPKDDESWTNWTLRNVGFGLFAGVPIARDVASVANQKMGGGFGSYAVTPAARGYDALEAVTKDAWRGMSGEGDVSDKWVKHAIEAPGYIFGLPTGQVGSTTQFLWDLHTGNQTAESAGEWYRGLLTGKAHNE